ncbi:MAG: tRNA lysidine(34) synthetase TilS [Pseudomonadota bacterium]
MTFANKKLIAPHRDNITLVAVSGGGDSMALLHLLLVHWGAEKLAVATVDHRLRDGSSDEADQVARWCAERDIRHEVLVWDTPKKASASARDARYRLLIDHARSIGSRTIALGHTQDDQAETIIMRAQRSKKESGTRGLSGMSMNTQYEDITLWRPLLTCSRDSLRAYLLQQDIDWTEDPSNTDMQSERVAVRAVLNTKTHLPDAQQIARFADLCASSRLWLGKEAAVIISRQVTQDADGSFVLARSKSEHPLLITEVFGALILAAGGMARRVHRSKYMSALDAYLDRRSTRCTAGRCLIEVRKRHVRFSREVRGDTQTHQSMNSVPGLERFRSPADDPLHEVFNRVIAESKATCSGKRVQHKQE